MRLSNVFRPKHVFQARYVIMVIIVTVTTFHALICIKATIFSRIFEAKKRTKSFGLTFV